VKNAERRARASSRGGRGLRGLVRLIGLALLVASIVRELRLPKEARTWHGVVFGLVPYDLRRPSFDRFKATLWNPRDPHLFVPTALGVGWTVNVAALRARLRGAPAA
jgi:hypothetical protein